MANENIVIKYCLEHGEEFEVRPYQGRDIHLAEDSYLCVGPFAEVPPPSPLTDEDWDFILEGEHYYAS